MVSKGTTQFNEPARVWPCLLIYLLIFQTGKTQGVRSIKDIRDQDQNEDRSIPAQQAIVLDLWSVIYCQPPKLTLLRINRRQSGHCPSVTPLYPVPSHRILQHRIAPHRITSHTILPSWRARPDILTNNFIDALFRAVCVWFLIVAQLSWTHVIIAHFMTHLSKTISRSRPWHCPLSAQPSQLLIFRITLCLTTGREHSSVSSRLDWRSGSSPPSHQSQIRQSRVIYLAVTDPVLIAVSYCRTWQIEIIPKQMMLEGTRGSGVKMQLKVVLWILFSLWVKTYFVKSSSARMFSKSFNMILFDLFFGLSPYQ